MSDNTAISWTDATWNPVTGCTKVSDGCTRCYIDRTPPFRMDHRKFNGTETGATTGVKLHSERLHIPLKWRKPRRIFVCSLADLFQDEVPDRFITEVFAVMALAQQHTFQVLTKRHARLRSLLGSPAFLRLVENRVYQRHAYAPRLSWPLRNVWAGVSVENQQWADIRIPALLETPAAVRWISAEPLLGHVDLTAWTTWSDGSLRHSEPEAGIAGLDWVVVGGESGPGARPMHPQWARDLRDQCVGTNVAYHFKQFGEWGPADEAIVARDPRTMAMHPAGMVALTPDNPFDPFERGHPHWEALRRHGKKAAGRELDGRTWDEYPEAS